jgi:cytochrome c-type biogenesis protein
MNESVSLAVAFGGGLLSFVSPCVLPMVPVYLASLYGPELFEGRGFRPAVLFHALSFVIGFTAVFVLLGAVAGLTGYAVIPDYHTLSVIAGWVLVSFGAFIIASYWVPWLNYERHLRTGAGRTTGYLRSVIIGAVFSVSWTACVGPILGSILAIAAVQATAWKGASLLAVYSVGLGLPFLIIGAAFDWLLPLLKRLNRYAGAVRLGSGILLVIIGALVLTGRLTWLQSLAG